MTPQNASNFASSVNNKTSRSLMKLQLMKQQVNLILSIKAIELKFNIKIFNF